MKKRMYPASDSAFAHALYKYVGDQGTTYKQFATDCGFDFSLLSFWIHGYKCKCGRIYPGYEHILKMYHSKHRKFIMDCIDKGLL